MTRIKPPPVRSGPSLFLPFSVFPFYWALFRLVFLLLFSPIHLLVHRDQHIVGFVDNRSLFSRASPFLFFLTIVTLLK